MYGLLAVQAGIPSGDHVFDLVPVTIALSIVLHSIARGNGARGLACPVLVTARPAGVVTPIAYIAGCAAATLVIA